MPDSDEPRWVRDEYVLIIHQRQLERYKGIPGVRDTNLLASALARPRNLLAYGDPTPDMAALAASYAYGIVRNHPFADGNKRAGFMVSLAFLRLNGYDLVSPEEENYQTFIRLAEGNLAEEELAQWMRENMVSGWAE